MERGRLRIEAGICGVRSGRHIGVSHTSLACESGVASDLPPQSNEEKLEISGRKFSYPFPPRSLSVVRVTLAGSGR